MTQENNLPAPLVLFQQSLFDITRGIPPGAHFAVQGRMIHCLPNTEAILKTSDLYAKLSCMGHRAHPEEVAPIQKGINGIIQAYDTLGSIFPEIITSMLDAIPLPPDFTPDSAPGIYVSSFRSHLQGLLPQPRIDNFLITDGRNTSFQRVSQSATGRQSTGSRGATTTFDQNEQIFRIEIQT